MELVRQVHRARSLVLEKDVLIQQMETKVQDLQEDKRKMNPYVENQCKI